MGSCDTRVLSCERCSIGTLWDRIRVVSRQKLHTLAGLRPKPGNLVPASHHTNPVKREVLLNSSTLQMIKLRQEGWALIQITQVRTEP